MSVRFERGRWVVDYYPHGRKGKRRRIRLPEGTTEAEARRIEQELKKRRSLVPPPGSLLIKNLVPDFLNYVKLHNRPRTVKDKESCFKHHLIPFFGNYRIEDLSSGLLLLYQKTRKQEINRRGEPVSHRTINKELSYFFSFLRWARKYLGVEPLQKLEYESLPYKRPIPNVLTLEEAVKFITAADQPYRAFFCCLFTLGLRFEEARTLRWKDVDLQNRVILVRQKGDKPNILPITDWLYNELVQLRNLNHSEWVFPSKVNRNIPIKDVRRAIERARKRAGIAKKVHPHLLRHSLATYLAAQDINLSTIKEILGHSDIATTRFYTQIAIEHKKQALVKAGLNSIPVCDHASNLENTGNNAKFVTTLNTLREPKNDDKTIS